MDLTLDTGELKVRVQNQSLIFTMIACADNAIDQERKCVESAEIKLTTEEILISDLFDFG